MQFATKNRPLRISSLPMLITCPLRAVLLSEGLLSDESGTAADTGSLFHAYVSTWHTNGQKVADAVASVDAAASERFPLADRDRAYKWFQAYQADPRNREAMIEAVELPVSIVLPNPYGEPIYMSGTLDQIRQERDGFRVWDHKTGKSYGLSMLDQYAFQLAGYTIAAAQYLGVERMLAPGIVRIQGYDARGCDPSSSPDGVFFTSVLTWERCQMLLAEIVQIVNDVRAGRVDIRPGFHCGTVCPARGMQTCLHLSERL